MSYVDVKLSAADKLRREIVNLEERLVMELLTTNQRESIKYGIRDLYVELNNVEIELMRAQPWTKKAKKKRKC